MEIVIRWKDGRPSRSETPAMQRMRAVLKSAADTHYYRPWLEAARLLGPGKLERLSSLSDALACVPRVELAWFLEHHWEFRNRRGAPALQSILAHPAYPVPRTAILALGFEQSPNIASFDRSAMDALLKFGPESIAAPLDSLLHLARAIRRGRFALPTLRHSLVAFSDIRTGLLNDADRDALWSAFQVPVYEQLRGLSGELLGSECEAHNGLHLCPREAVLEFDSSRRLPEMLFTSLVDLGQPAIRLATGWSPHIENATCPCGSSLPRLTAMVQIDHVPALARAAAC